MHCALREWQGRRAGNTPFDRHESCQHSAAVQVRRWLRQPDVRDENPFANAIAVSGRKSYRLKSVVLPFQRSFTWHSDGHVAGQQQIRLRWRITPFFHSGRAWLWARWHFQAFFCWFGGKFKESQSVELLWIRAVGVAYVDSGRWDCRCYRASISVFSRIASDF